MITLHAGQQAVHDDLTRFRVCAKGRRWGSTTYAAYACLEVASRGGYAAWVTPFNRVMEWNVLQEVSQQFPDSIIRHEDTKIKFQKPNNGTVILAEQRNLGILRGWAADLVILDGCESLPDSVWNLYARHMVIPNGRVLFFVTPPGYLGHWVQKLYGTGLDDEFPDWSSHRCSTNDNPKISPDSISEVKATISDLDFRRQFLAEFVDTDEMTNE